MISVGSVVQVHPGPPLRKKRGHSSAGRAPALQAGGRRFDPDWLHECEEGKGKNKRKLKQKREKLRRQETHLISRKKREEKKMSPLYSERVQKFFNN